MSPDGGPDRSNGRRRSTAARPTDDELLDAARVVFAQRGFTGATMDGIAEQANSTKPTLYAHFGDKAALYRTLLNRETEALGGWVIAVYQTTAELPPAERTRGNVMALFNYAAAHPDSFRILFDWTSGDVSPERQNVIRAITENVAGQVRRYFISQGRQPGPSSGLLAAMMVGLVSGAARYAALVEGIDVVAAGELAAEVIIAATAHLDPAVLDKIDSAESADS